MRPIISRSFIKKSFSNRSFFKVTAFLLAAGALPATARADQYPGGRPIEMTVMFGAGSAADVTARYLADFGRPGSGGESNRRRRGDRIQPREQAEAGRPFHHMEFERDFFDLPLRCSAV